MELAPSNWLNALLYLRYPRLTHRYRQRFNRRPDYVTPTTYSEKVQWRKLFDRNPLFPVFLDKIAVRDYVAARAPELGMAELLWTGTDPGSIPFDALPSRCVIKPNCRSGSVCFVQCPADLQPEVITAQCRKWLSRPYDQAGRQWGYRDIKRRIMVEEFLDTHPDEDVMGDVRFHLFNGRVHLITYGPSRIVDGARIPLGKTSYYDKDWRQLPYVNTAQQADVPPPLPRPPQLERMVAAAEALGEGVDHVRVDLYLGRERPYFGEITVYPLSGFGRFRVVPDTELGPAEDFETRFGRAWRLPRIAPLKKACRGLLG